MNYDILTNFNQFSLHVIAPKLLDCLEKSVGIGNMTLDMFQMSGVNICLVVIGNALSSVALLTCGVPSLVPNSSAALGCIIR